MSPTPFAPTGPALAAPLGAELTTHSLHGLLVARARRSGAEEAYVDGDQRLTYDDALRRAGSLAAHLVDAGVLRGDRVLVLAKNGEFLATAVFAAARIGAVAVIGNWRLPAPELRHVIEDSSPVAVLHDAAFAGTIDTALAGRDLRARVVDGPGYEEIVDDASAVAPTPADVDPDDPAVLMYTSGTTGRPKGAILTHANLLWSADGMSQTIAWEAGQRFLLVAPMFHIGGLAPLITNVLRGCSTVFLADFDPGVVWRTIERERIAMMMTVPVMLQAMLQVARATQVDPSSLVSVTCGGSMVPASLLSAAAEMGINTQVVYGITELTGGVAFATRDMGDRWMTTQGLPVHHAQLRIVDPESGVARPAGEPGEVWCRGPQRFAGYWGDPTATAAAIDDEGWYRSGDVGVLGDEGFVRIVDRLKDMLISGGENVYPAELEHVIRQLPGVRDVAVVGRPDERWGEVAVAHVVREADSALTTEEVLDWCRENLAGYKRPKDVILREQLPVNAVGKILKAALREESPALGA